ncbi:MAG: outer membrane protein assembly factor BamD [Desulfobacteraceae bacterium]|nr:MAG: outer membrane protein assembly factor BamD [Desulfobacteraceae bacterium]
MKTYSWFIILVLALVCSSCAWLGWGEEEEMNKSANLLLSEGTSSFRSGDYKSAVRAYTDLKDWYPFSQYAILAELKIADAHYELEEYEEAIFAYEDFEKMHPKNEAIPYVIYKTGLCWFDQIGTVDRDSTPARKSLEVFTRLTDQYPDSKFSSMAENNKKVCLENLAGHELYVADFYLKTKKYLAALKRYEYLAQNFPRTKQAKEALTKIPECKKHLDEEKIEN